jgi:hypothetical protein
MLQLVSERIKQLREEIVLISAANRMYELRRKDSTAQGEHERRLQRLLEIVSELNSLTDWKTT